MTTAFGKSLTVCFSMAFLFFCSSESQAGPLTYSFIDTGLHSDHPQYFISGHVTTDGTTGQITSDNITEWEITYGVRSTGDILITFSSADLNARINSTGPLFASSSILMTTDYVINFIGGPPRPEGSAAYVIGIPVGGYVADSSSYSNLFRNANFPETGLVFATNGVVVPEPSSFGLFGVGGLALTVGWRRPRRNG